MMKTEAFTGEVLPSSYFAVQYFKKLHFSSYKRVFVNAEMLIFDKIMLKSVHGVNTFLAARERF
jgi:hypothetical protein